MCYKTNRIYQNIAIYFLGCSNWQPDVVDAAPETLDDKKNFINGADFSDINNHEHIFKLLDETFAIQRLFLNNQEMPPTLQDIRKEWPVLLIKEVLVWHYKKLMGQDLDEVFSKFYLKVNKIIAFGIQKKYIGADIPDDQNKRELLCFEVLGFF